MTSNSTRLSMLVAAIVIFWSTLPTPALADTVSFVARRDYEAGQSPVSVVVGDFNGDGVPDLAVANELDLNLSGGTVEVLLGKDDGTFQAARTVVAARARRTSIVVGDFNGDGVPDLAVANGRTPFTGGPGNIEVLLGNGDGTFQDPLTVATGGRPVSLAPGDFNGDGKPDLAVADFDSNTVLVLLGNGDGTFQAPRTFTTGARPSSVAAGDFNGDGALDLAVANEDNFSVSVLLGNGDGTFQVPSTFTTGARPQSVAVGDFDRDGTLDLAVEVSHRSEEHTSELQSPCNLVCRLLLEKKKNIMSQKSA